jgi:hypothetical protein
LGAVTGWVTVSFCWSFFLRHVDDPQDMAVIHSLVSLVGGMHGFLVSIMVVSHGSPELKWFIIPLSTLWVSVFFVVPVLLGVAWAERRSLVQRFRRRACTLPTMRAIKVPPPTYSPRVESNDASSSRVTAASSASRAA